MLYHDYSFTAYLEKTSKTWRLTTMDNTSDSDMCVTYIDYLLNVLRHPKPFSLGIDADVRLWEDMIHGMGMDGAIDFVMGMDDAIAKKGIKAPKSFRLKRAEMEKADTVRKAWDIILSLLRSKFWMSRMKESSFNPNSYPLAWFKAIRRRLRSEGNVQWNKTFAKRMGTIKDVFKLNDVDAAIVTVKYGYERYSSVENLITCLIGQCKSTMGMSNFNDAAYSVILGVPKESLADSMNRTRGLVHLGLVCDDGCMPTEIYRYLSGIGPDDFLALYAQPWKGTTLPLEKFGKEKDSKMMIGLIKSHDWKSPLNLLMHGTEGTGKTELARTLAKEAGCVLYDVGLNFGKQSFSRDTHRESIMMIRMRALAAADVILKDTRNVLMMDESDIMLNSFEKGLLNSIMDELTMPVIWIANDISGMSQSTKRRFHYSVEFSLGSNVDRRKLWDSVVEKHKAEDIFTPERRQSMADKFEIATGGIELAVRSEMAMRSNGFDDNAGEEILGRHVEFMGFKTGAICQSRAPRYDVSVLNIPRLDETMHSARCYAEKLKIRQADGNMTMLLYGPPGTGKTEFARYLARECGLSFREISYGQISSKWVGETEKQMAEAFRMANESGELLFIDEADSLIQDRRGAQRSWEVTQTNEFLVQLESAKCMVICSTNFQGHLDAASRRRFHFHLEFGYLKKDGIARMGMNFFPDFMESEWVSLDRCETLAPGDFFAVHKRLQWIPKEDITFERVKDELLRMADGKEAWGNRRIGF